MATVTIVRAHEALQHTLTGNPRLLYIDPGDGLRAEHLLYDAAESLEFRFQVYEPVFGGPLPPGRASRVETANYVAPFVEYLRIQIEQARDRRAVIFVRALESLLMTTPEAAAALGGLLEYLPDHRLTIVAPLRTEGPTADAAPYLIHHPSTRPLTLPPLVADEVEHVLRHLGHRPDTRLISEVLTLPYDRLVALAASVPTQDLLARIADAKEEWARQSGLVEVDTSRADAEVYGLDRLSTFIEQEILPPLKTGRPLDIKGILLLGPPGGGKTITGHMMARKLGKKLFKIRPTHSKYLGVSEVRFREATQIVDRAAPAVAMLDEVDREFMGSDSSADSGVTSRMFSELLQWIERNEQVFLVATSNAVQMLDPALVRPGRLDPRFFVGPNPQTRRALLHKAQQQFALELGDEEIDEIAETAWGFSGARIWFILKRASLRPDDAARFVRERIETERAHADKEYRQYMHLREVAEPASSEIDD